MRVTIRAKRSDTNTVSAPVSKRSRRQKAVPQAIASVTCAPADRKVTQADVGIFEFSIADHLLVQNAIESKAHEFWQADNCDSSRPLEHWLRAETQVLSNFCQRLVGQ